MPVRTERVGLGEWERDEAPRDDVVIPWRRLAEREAAVEVRSESNDCAICLSLIKDVRRINLKRGGGLEVEGDSPGRSLGVAEVDVTASRVPLAIASVSLGNLRLQTAECRDINEMCCVNAILRKSGWQKFTFGV